MGGRPAEAAVVGVGVGPSLRGPCRPPGKGLEEQLDVPLQRQAPGRGGRPGRGNAAPRARLFPRPAQTAMLARRAQVKSPR